ncbi:MAG: PD40 domain-containing protein [Anaerolineae bacterium]|nr:PD40 domain-containing protein [Anaerolineae bacterium]
MNEVEQIYDEILARVVLGLVVIGLIIAIAALTLGGTLSPWFIHGVALIIIGAFTFIFRMIGRVVVAAYILIFQLIGLIAEIMLQVDVLTSFIPYLLIPVAVIAGMLFDSTVALTLIGFSIGLSIFILFITHQSALGMLTLFLPPALLTLLTGILTAEGRKYIAKLGRRLEENRAILKDRTLTIMQSSRQMTELKQQFVALQSRLTEMQTKSAQVPVTGEENNRQFLELFEATVQRLNTQFRKLEEEIEYLEPKLGSNGHAPSLKNIWKKIDDLKSFLVNLEEVAHIEGGEVQLAVEAVDLQQLLGDVTHIAQGLARTKNLEVHYKSPESLPILKADPLRLRQALLHILSNAVKYTDQGLIEIHAKKIDNKVKITISDTGPGIARQEFDQVFEKFGLASNTLTRDRQGLGLGLSIAKYLIELHGGQVSVSSVVSVGSEFYITLPLEPISRKLDNPAVAAWYNPFASQLENTLVSTTDTDATILSNSDVISQILAERSEKWQPSNQETGPLSPLARSTPPVSRNGPMYSRRTGLIMLVLLVLVTGLVALLAYINGPVVSSVDIAATATEPGATATLPTPTSTVEHVVALNNTATPTPTSTFTPTAENTPTSTPRPSLTPTLKPSPSPSPSPSSTPSPVVPTLAPSPSSTPSPTIITSSPGVISPAALTLPGVKILRLLSSQRISYVDFEVLLAPTEALKPDPNGRMNWSATGQPLFTGDQNNDRDVYIIDANNEPFNLSDAPGDDLHPAWSPDGRHVVFSSGRTGNFEIYTIDADGENLTQLTTSQPYEEWPVWSPDGRQIAFISDQNGNADLFVMAADGSNPRQLTDDPADDWPASWSPDNRQLVFASNRDGNWNLYVISANGGDALRLTNDPTDERDPIWSSASNTIAFTSNRGDSWDIYTLDVPSPLTTEIPASAWTQITNTPTDERYPTWLPAPVTP